MSLDGTVAVFGTILTLVGGGIFYSGHRESQQAKTITELPYTSFSDLEKMMTNVPDGTPTKQYVKMSGRIGTEQPLVSPFTKEQCAVYEHRDIGVWYSLKYRTSGEEDFLRDKIRRETPFFIQDPKTSGSPTRLWIKTFDEQPELEQVHRYEEKSGNFLLSLFLSFFRIHYPYKTVHTESILPLNRDLLVMGNLSKSRDGRVVLNRADDDFFSIGKPSVLSLKSEEDVAEEYRRSGFVGKVLGAVLFTT
eukprot:CAMPEP_0168568470 /NCGR_PEP_ID=MMETSP0413-20121227/15596_1 /TAXON_ID=136452 /ORGANISM="Filamoeba nolandi, Strain NC-AS-23-1" /LENGTH=248 /DNA_ID=CAMNT_0008600811 /DNA_START=29 /DNA_END=772 /DNA_ORIENTATION=+